MTTNPVLEVDRSSLGRTRLVDDGLADLSGGSVRLRIDRLAVTANTVTYGLVGDLLGYWDFYPTADPAFGRVPAMGWAEVVESAHPEIEPGGRYYGWFPMAGYVDAEVAPVPTGLRADGAHRHPHAPVYRTYVRADADPLFAAPSDAPLDALALGDLEDRHALLRGLFLTGFLADAFFADQSYLGAEQAVVVSASSKTAIGFAHQASRRALHVVGITSASNVAFVEALGCYRQVLPYDQADRLDVVPSVSVDLSGNQVALAAVHERLGDRLAHSMVIGNSHQGDMGGELITSGPRPEFFFAPTAVDRLVDSWGRAEFERRTTEALRAFVEDSHRWLRVERSSGPTATEATWQAVVAGRVPPDIGRIVSLHD